MASQIYVQNAPKSKQIETHPKSAERVFMNKWPLIQLLIYRLVYANMANMELNYSPY